MSKTKIAFSVLLFAVVAVSGFAFARAPGPGDSGGGICGAWEPIGGTSFRRLCCDGARCWYDYN